MAYGVRSYLFAIANNNIISFLALSSKISEAFFDPILVSDVQKATFWLPE